MSSRCQNKQGGALTHAEAARVVLHTSSSIRTGKTLARSSACGAVQAGIFFTVGPGVSPGQRTRFKRPVADFTASGEFHPALKTSYPVVCKHYTTDGGKMQPPNFRGWAICGQIEKLCRTLYANGKKYIKIGNKKKDRRVVSVWSSPNSNGYF